MIESATLEFFGRTFPYFVIQTTGFIPNSKGQNPEIRIGKLSDHCASIYIGTTTFRLKGNGLTILHDTWLDKPALMKRYLELDDVTELDYIVISHAHFDQ